MALYKTIDEGASAGSSSLATYAVKATADELELVGVTDVTLSAQNIELEVNRSGQDLSGVEVDTGGLEADGVTAIVVDMSFDDGSDVTRLRGDVVIDVLGFVSLSGTFSFEKTDVRSGTVVDTEIKVGATGVTAFVGTGFETADEMGVKAVSYTHLPLQTIYSV